MDLFAHLAIGFQAAVSPANLAACIAGCALGTLVGVLPGLGPVAAIALLLPFTFSLEPSGAIIMLAGLYCGTQYGGSTTAILLNLPGEASSAITCLDGHALARDGRGGLALATAALASFAAGTFAALLMAFAALPMTAAIGGLGPADYAALMVAGLLLTVTVEGTRAPQAIVTVVAGLLLGAVGTSVATGTERFTLGVGALYDGIGFLPLAIGLFGISEIVASLAESGTVIESTSRRNGSSLRPGELRRASSATARGTAVGSVLGMLPGGGPTLAAFAAYSVEKVFATGRGDLGRGAIEGVAGPESANNAAAQTSFLPLLILGVPSNAVVALLLSALIVHGVQPGPDIVAKEPRLFWGLIVSMWISNLVLLVLNLPLVGLWTRLLSVPSRYLHPITLALACTGLYAVNHSTFDVWLAAAFGVIGYGLRIAQVNAAPLLLGFVLSRPIEENAQRALAFANGDWTTFVTHPVGATVGVIVTSGLVIWVVRQRAVARGNEST